MKIVIVTLLLGFLVSCGEVVPPGTTVIKLTTSGETEIYNQGVYQSYGRDRIYFVDSKLQSFTESLKILCSDDINMYVDVKWVGSFDVSDDKIDIIKSKVPAKRVDNGDINGFQLDLVEFYNKAMKDIIISNARSIVAMYSTDDIRPNREVIELALQKTVLERFTKLNYPVNTTDLMISNLDYDMLITKQRQEIKKAELEDAKQAALARARIAQARRNEEIAIEEGKAIVARAMAKAKENNILSKSITPEILALKQWEVLEKMAEGPNNELLVVPYDALKSSNIGTYLNRMSLKKNK